MIERRLLSRIALGAWLLALAGCADRTAPPRTHALGGHVRLIGYMTASDSHFLGTRVVEDADGVAVELLRGTTVLMRTTTVDGNYRFTGVEPGGYVARAMGASPVVDVTTGLTIATTDVTSGDTLVLASQGDLYPAPNPTLDEIFIGFETSESLAVEIDVRDIAGRLVQHLVTPTFVMPPGFHSAIWDGHDIAGTLVPQGLYWVVFRSGADQRGQLLFREPAPPGAFRPARPKAGATATVRGPTPLPRAGASLPNAATRLPR